MPIQRYTARVSESEPVAAKYHFLHIELIEPHRLSFVAGQYILLEVPGTEQKKSYSICSSATVDHALQFLIDVSPGGFGSKYIQALKPGDEVHFMAPVGQFVIAQPDTPVGAREKALVFVATGTGITPIKSMVMDQLQVKKDTRPMIVYWGLRYENDVCWLEDFEELARTFPNFQLHLVLSKAEESWPLCRGHVTDCLEIHEQPQDAGYYLCGNKPMIDEVQKMLLAKGILQEHIHHEKFY
jgi:ferredoxin-NADP reductase